MYTFSIYLLNNVQIARCSPEKSVTITLYEQAQQFRHEYSAEEDGQTKNVRVMGKAQEGKGKGPVDPH